MGWGGGGGAGNQPLTLKKLIIRFSTNSPHELPPLSLLPGKEKQPG